jgi:Fe-S-cluster-containing hydrogenase component 2
MQVSPLDCTGCSLCKRVCAAGALSMAPLGEVAQQQDAAWLYAKSLPSRWVAAAAASAVAVGRAASGSRGSSSSRSSK